MLSAFGVDDDRISKAGKPMSDKELRTRKKAQAVTSVAGGTLGLAALGSKGAAAGLPKILSRVGQSTPKAKAYVKNLNEAANTLTIGGAGIGGAGAFNFASIQNAESKRKQPGVIKKAESKHRVKNAAGYPKRLGGRTKTAHLRPYDPEARRENRGELRTAVLSTGSGVAAGRTLVPSRTQGLRDNTPDLARAKKLQTRGQRRIKRSVTTGLVNVRDAPGFSAKLKAGEKAVKGAQKGVRDIQAAKVAGKKVTVVRVPRTAKQLKVARTKTGAIAALLGAGAVASDKHRKSTSASRYGSWYS